MKKRNIPFGYQYTEGTISLHPKESMVISQICHAYLEGKSLLDIAKWLCENGIEYMPGMSVWSKSRVMRIFDDERYLGNAKFPTIIDEETHRAIGSMKSDKNSQKALDRDADIFKIAPYIRCPVCQAKMQRQYDSRCKNKVRWACTSSSCQTFRKKDDQSLIDDVASIINDIRENPEIIQEQLQEEATDHFTRINNDVTMKLNNVDMDRKGLRKHLLASVSSKYQAINSSAYTSRRLKNIFSTAIEQDTFPADLLEKAVMYILLEADGTVTLTLINNQNIRKEKDNGFNRNPTTESGQNHTANH